MADSRSEPLTAQLNQMHMQHAGTTGGVAQEQTFPTTQHTQHGFRGVGGGAGDSFVRVATRVNRHSRCDFGFVTRHLRYTFGLEGMADSMFEVCLCVSLVLLLRLSGLKCPSPISI